ncbi:Uma2 family endonuclease [Nocardioides massiliensis]|uniref:Uma2 family endonuclease n=1 Tax=Nocardioides massiliensis TaxID=1325935 RepID=A0ABT9NJF1_9ACTN|nr:Uma2 family endonuclease [Nocardioides massiliensis]MDP9820543.1 Uma2 family endonuclease [Nocardioides massiliensis]
MGVALQSQPMTRAERDALPEDGRRHELIDGMLVMTPAPGVPHQGVVGELYVLLRAALPDDSGMRVMLGPLDVTLAEDTVVEPDLLVARRDDFTEKELPHAPLLAVEVLSPSTRLYDLTLKKARYEKAGCAAYWVIDPLEPRLVAWELVDGAYVEVVSVVGDEAAQLTAPFPVEITPDALVLR